MPERALVQLILWAVFGLITAMIAKSRGRNPAAWFAIGIVGGCFALLLVLVLPDMNVVRAKELADQAEMKRLNELLAQERLKNQAFRGHTLERLDKHDAALGVDTRAGAGDPLIAAPPPPLPADDGIPADGWYVGTPDGVAEGPLSLDVLQRKIESGELRPTTLVWHASLTNWTTAALSPLGKRL